MQKHFFFTGMILLAGLNQQNILQTSTGLFLSSISRSAANVFLPAILLTSFINSKKVNIKQLAIYSLIILISIGIVAYIQYLQTGFAWGFIQTQKHWQHELQWPKLPFTSWGQYVWLDAVALFFGLLCGFYSLKLIWNRIKTRQKIDISAATIFAVLCLAGLTALPVIMNGGSFFSLNRYLLASPFLAIVFVHFLNRWEFSLKQVALIFGLMFLTFAGFHFFNHIRPILEYTVIAGYLTAVLFLKHENVWLQRLAFLGLYTGNTIMQAHLADRFLRGEWIG